MTLQTLQSTQTTTIPTFYFEHHFGEETPLSSYGRELLSRLQMSHPERYLQLSFQGTLMKELHQCENDLKDIKFMLMQELERKFPRPVTTDFLVIAAHMSQIDEEAERVIKKLMRNKL